MEIHVTLDNKWSDNGMQWSLSLSLSRCFAAWRTTTGNRGYKLLIFKHASYFFPCFINQQKFISKHKHPRPKPGLFLIYRQNLNKYTDKYKKYFGKVLQFHF